MQILGPCALPDLEALGVGVGVGPEPALPARFPVPVYCREPEEGACHMIQEVRTAPYCRVALANRLTSLCPSTPGRVMWKSAHEVFTLGRASGRSNAITTRQSFRPFSILVFGKYQGLLKHQAHLPHWPGPPCSAWGRARGLGQTPLPLVCACSTHLLPNDVICTLPGKEGAASTSSTRGAIEVSASSSLCPSEKLT